MDGEVSAEAELNQEKDAVADVTTEMNKAEIVDREDEEGAAEAEAEV